MFRIIVGVLLFPSLLFAGPTKKFPDGISTSILNVDNVTIDGNTISSSNANGNVIINPNGSGVFNLPDLSTGLLHVDGSGNTSSSLLVNADVSPSAAIAYSKLNLTGLLVNADFSASAAIARSKIANGTLNALVVNNGSTGALSELAVGSNNTVLGSNGTSASWLGTLTNINLATPSADVIGLDGQGSAPSNPSAGFYKMYVKDSTGMPVILNSSGVESEIGSGGGSGGTNQQYEYISNGKAEASTNGWATYADAAGASPVDGTGGTSTGVTLTRQTTNALRGTGMFQLDKDNSNRQGMGASYDFVVDNRDTSTNSPVYISFDYRTWPSYVAGDVRVFVYDKTTPVLINVFDSNGGNGSIPVSSGSSTFTGYFYPNTISADYRLIFHIASTNANSYTLWFDSVHVGNNPVIPGSIRTPYVQYTPTISGFGTPTNVAFFSRRVDDTLEFHGAFDTGTPQASTAQFTLGFNGQNANVTIADSPKITANGNQTAGTAEVAIASATIFGYSILATANSQTIGIGIQSSTNGATVARNGNVIASASGQRITVKGSVPIKDWDVSPLMSTTEMLFSSAQFTGVRSGNQTISTTGLVKINWNSVQRDNLSWWDSTNDRLVVKKKMRYMVDASVGTGSAQAEAYTLYVYVNGSPVRANYVNGANPTVPVRAPLDLNPTDYVEIFIQSTADNSYTVNANAYTFFSVTAMPELSSYSVYGQFELLTAVSSVKTLSGTGHFANMTGNSISLTPGTWRLWGTITFSNNGSSPAYANIGGSFFGANGGDSGTVPQQLSATGGVTVLTPNSASSYEPQNYYSSSAGSNIAPITPIVIRVSQATSVYLVPVAALTTAANSRVTAYAYAERLQ